ncbi:MAG: MgtC/SapB family protein [Bacteroidetes bacterium]|nr:MgtC/SapB family protein [Bacteroidota bacterium]MBS1632460.1 MgtC/SapB family protein [Bacteroidota bacterium]
MIDWTEILLRLGLAAFFGAVIGVERERKEWAAGLRTHMMVCLGSSLIMMVSAYGFADVLNTKNVTLDPSRVAAQVVSGIGFIGAGTILFLRQGVIRGLTTASGLWTVAAIGLATGGGMYTAALLTTIIALFILWVLDPIENYFFNKYKPKNLRITTGSKNKSSEIINKIINNKSLSVLDFVLDKSNDDFVVSFKFKFIANAELANIMNDLNSDSEIKEVTWNS